MKHLNNIVQSLTKDEIRFYKLFVGRTKQTKERKDLILFDLLKKSPDEKISNKITDKLNITSNNFYQLKHRIYNDLNNSMVWQHISKDQQSKSFRFVLLARVFKNKGELELAYHYLQIAEKEAISLELFEILSIVYSEIIELSHELISIDLKKYIELKIQNTNVLNEIEKTDLLLAQLMFDIKTKQNFSSSDPELIEKLTNNYASVSKNKDVLNSPRFKMRLFKMYSRLLLQEKDYKGLKEFLISSYEDFTSNGIFNRSNHNDKLTLLTYLTNSLYKLKEHKASLEYAELLKESLEEHDGFLSDKFIFYYYNSLVLNYSVEDKPKALTILEKASKNEVIKKLPAYTTFIYLNTALLHYYLSDYANASRNIARLIQQEDFLLLGELFRLKLQIVELIIKLSLQKNHLVIEKIKAIKSEHKLLLKAEKAQRDVKLLSIISKVASKDEFADEVKDFQSKFISDEDIDIINYNDWLKKITH